MSPVKIEPASAMAVMEEAWVIIKVATGGGGRPPLLLLPPTKGPQSGGGGVVGASMVGRKENTKTVGR